ncbi:MAG: protein-ADP-ribose hydrolase [Marinifilaceae bacterium]|jgi:O-acetyl-ADP-ribose deacetylase (regulator of RNase III)|nr:protein-ADP-ribose hydrolase [Marinifilaceae bacterium]
MSIDLKSYREAINLDLRFVPQKSTSSLNDLLSYLAKEKSGQQLLSQINLEDEEYSTRELIRALLTVRPSGGVTDELVAMIDSMLQQELKHKTITPHQSIATVEGNYPSKAKVSVWNGDISTLKIDAIVNAGNNQMLGCFVPFHNCIDNVIHNASGIMLREACATIMNLQGSLETTGCAKITRAYNLPSNFVLHTVGPIVRGREPNEMDKQDLRNAYESCLNLAKEQGTIKSIAFCSISTGVFGYPIEQASELALETVNNWLENNPNTIEHVVFNTFGDETTAVYTNLLNQWK